jgi:2-methylisocitrate lyase-like PEP mutase family enzyme
MGARLRSLLGRGQIVVAPGAADAWTGRLIEEAGFSALYVTGAGIANVLLGVPDIGMTTLTEVAGQAKRIADAVQIPVIADADTGFGGVASIQRTVREYERAGLAGLHIEDQQMPKRCGHFDGKSIVPAEEMVLRLHAALDARRDPDFVIIARTDARAVEGLEATIRRARLYAAVGVDALFVEAPTSVDEFRVIGRELPSLPLVANMVEGGRSPLLPAEELRTLGFSLVLYPNLALRLGAFAIKRGLQVLRQSGTSAGLLDRILPWDERQALVKLPQAEADERRLLDRSARTMQGHR